MKQICKRFTYANVMSSLAVFLVLGGGAAVAAGHLGRNSVGTKQLKSNSVTTAKIKKNSISAAKIRAGAVGAGKLGPDAVSGANLAPGSVGGEKLTADSVNDQKLANGAVTESKIASGAVTNQKLADGSVTGSKINLSSLGTVPSAAVAQSLANVTPLKLSRATSSATAPTETAAVAAATPVSLYDDGHFTVYGKCFITTEGGEELSSVVYIATKQDGAIFDSDDDELSGEAPEGYLNTATPENQREVISDETEPNEANMQYEGDTEFGATASDGYTIQGVNQVAEKLGSPAAGVGPYGPGNVCLFSGYVIHS